MIGEAAKGCGIDSDMSEVRHTETMIADTLSPWCIATSLLTYDPKPPFANGWLQQGDAQQALI